ncbi:amidohydrolase family protein [Mycolicibacterium septicum]|uniref:amidohydrolase family protein n=1 Tax=Mycolicibacterium septicum TaxID=98668 RepID=UPI00235E9453|nr:amidohydrolase family protein [Mycolicibacterium septicum]
MQRITVVSGDGHFGGAIDNYKPYIDPAYRDRLDDLASEDAGNLAFTGMQRNSMLVPGVYEKERLAIATDLGDDVAKRLAVQDDQGISGEILLVGTDHTQPFFTVTNRVYPSDVRDAGVRAYHRWVADVISEGDGRLFPVGYAGEIQDMDESIAELQWMAEHGFVSVFLPGYVTDTRAPIYDRYYDPFWTAVADLGLVVNLHVGWGMPQGAITNLFDMALAADSKALDIDGFDLENFGSQVMEMMDANNEGSPFALDVGPRQGVWQLMISGVFDRHPTLKLMMTELRADWVPATLAFLDQQFAKHPHDLELTPSEYFYRNCALTPTSPHRVEVQMRHEIGVDHFLFGADIPHPESTWPHTREWIRHAFASVPEEDTRKILGGNAIRFYNLDSAHLDEIAAKIGPTVEEVYGGIDVDQQYLDNWHNRAGYLKPVEQINTDKLAELVDADFAQLGNR